MDESAAHPMSQSKEVLMSPIGLVTDIRKNEVAAEGNTVERL
jgi:hypothetical protein